MFIHVPLRHRAEHPHVVEAMTLGQGADFGTTRLDQDVHETTQLLLLRSQPPDHSAVSTACPSVITPADRSGPAPSLSMRNEHERAFGFQPEMSMNSWLERVCAPSEDDLASRSGDSPISNDVGRLLAGIRISHNYMRTSLGISARQNRTHRVSRQTSAFASLEKPATL